MIQYEDTETEHGHDKEVALFAAFWAVGTVLVLIVIKTYAFFITDSVAVLGSLTDSITDMMISLMMLGAVRYSMQPADEDHRHGHGKIEGIASLFQAAFLAGAGAFLTFEALLRFYKPQNIENPVPAMVICVVSIVLSLVLIAVQNIAVTKTSSLAIEADKSHYSSDVFLNLGVILALYIQYKNGPAYADSLIALCIAGYIFYTAASIARKASDMLMDRELSDEDRMAIIRIVESHARVHGMHDLRTRRSGMDIHISFDIEVEPDQSLTDAHQIARELEMNLLNSFPNADIIIHIDPKGDIYDARHRVQGIHH